MVGDIRLLPILLGIALEDRIAQIVDRGRNIDRVTIGLHPRQSVEQAFKDTQIGRRANRACIGRKAEQDDPHLLVGVALTPEQRKALCFFDKADDPLGAWRHRLGRRSALAHQRTALATIKPMPPTKDGRVGGAINLGKCDQHRGLNRPQPTGR